ncbi:hypothetical protein C8Q73DRAFT_770981 [Cubamyces lactineus]|nr:hypothetical protein C8Q73DRAFT_770981 [Cubamyces lactineus]
MAAAGNGSSPVHTAHRRCVSSLCVAVHRAASDNLSPHVGVQLTGEVLLPLLALRVRSKGSAAPAASCTSIVRSIVIAELPAASLRTRLRHVGPFGGLGVAAGAATAINPYVRSTASSVPRSASRCGAIRVRRS